MPSDSNPTKVSLLRHRHGVIVESIWNAFQSQVMPPVIKPKEQSQFIFDKVRGYIHDPTKRDNVCSRPQGVTVVSSAGGTSQQAGDSELTAIRNHVLMPENSGADNINWFWFFQEEM